MFDVGQHVICIRREPWKDYFGRPALGPAYGDECVVADFVRAGSMFSLESGRPEVIRRDAIDAAGWPYLYPAEEFIPKSGPLAEMILRAAKADKPADVKARTQETVR